jgi:chromate reductase
MRDLMIVGLSGSLRRGSFNAALLEAARELAPPGMTIESFGRLREIPPYDDDARQSRQPEPVRELWDQVTAADGLVIATPEYNFGPPGVLKNAIDWISRPADQSPLRGKPIALMGASTGRMGTVRAQLALRQSFAYLDAHVVNKPEVLISAAASAFAGGRLIDEAARSLVAEQLGALAALIDRWGPRAG